MSELVPEADIERLRDCPFSVSILDVVEGDLIPVGGESR